MEGVWTHRWTRREYERLGETGILAPDARVELIDGEIIEMSPQNSLHATAIVLVQQALTEPFRDGYFLRVQLPLDLGERNQPEPDVAVVQGEVRSYRTKHPTAAALVIEVSDSTLTFDQTHKLAVYAQARIPEYWIVNLVAYCVEVYREPHGNTYRSKATYDMDNQLAPLARPEAAIDVADLLP